MKRLLERFSKESIEGPNNSFGFNLVKQYYQSKTEVESLSETTSKYIIPIKSKNGSLVPTFNMERGEEVNKLFENIERAKARRDSLLSKIQHIDELLSGWGVESFEKLENRLRMLIGNARKTKHLPDELKRIQDEVSQLNEMISRLRQIADPNSDTV